MPLSIIYHQWLHRLKKNNLYTEQSKKKEQANVCIYIYIHITIYTVVGDSDAFPRAKCRQCAVQKGYIIYHRLCIYIIPSGIWGKQRRDIADREIRDCRASVLYYRLLFWLIRSRWTRCALLKPPPRVEEGLIFFFFFSTLLWFIELALLDWSRPRPTKKR